MTDQPSALTVVTPFGDHAAGDRIADADAVSSALASHPHHVVPLAAVPGTPAVPEIPAAPETPAAPAIPGAPAEASVLPAQPALPAEAAAPAAAPQPVA